MTDLFKFPTVEQFDPQVYVVRAGDLENTIIRYQGINPSQVESVSHMANSQLTQFKIEEPISATLENGKFLLSGGHHRTNEITRRAINGELPADE